MASKNDGNNKSDAPTDKKTFDQAKTSQLKDASGQKRTQKQAAARGDSARLSASTKPLTIDLSAKDVTREQNQNTQPPDMVKETAKNKDMGVPKAGRSGAPNQRSKSDEQEKDTRGPIEGKGTGEASEKPQKDEEATLSAYAKNSITTTPTPVIGDLKKPAKSGLFFQLIGAAFLGGAIALGSWAGLQRSNILQSDGRVAIEDLASRMDAYEDAPGVDAVSQSQFATLIERIDEIEQEIADNELATSTDMLARISALEARLADQGSGAVPTDGTEPSTNGINAVPSGQAERLAAIEERLTAQEDMRVSDQLSAVSGQISALDQALTQVKQTLTEERSTDNFAVQIDETALISAAEQAAIDKLEPQISSLRKQVEEAGSIGHETNNSVDILSNELIALNNTLSDLRTGLQMVALDRLKQAINNHRVMPDALNLVDSAGVDVQTMDTLRAANSAGIRSKRQLREDLDNLILRSVARAGPNELTDEPLSAFDKLARNAKNFIKIRSLRGEGPDPYKAMQERFDDDDLAGFLTAYKTLNGSQRKLFEVWLSAWQSRLEIIDIIAKLENNLAARRFDDQSAE